MKAISVKKKPIVKAEHSGVGQHLASDPAYAARFSLYQIPPTEDISIEEWQDFAIDRLKVLTMIDDGRAAGLKGTEFNNRILSALDKYLPLHLNNLEDVRKDVISHFTLRLAYCRGDERKWFVSKECELFRFRTRRLDYKDLEKLLQNNNLHYPTLSQEEFDDLRSDLHAVITSTRRGKFQTDALKSENFHRKAFYKVPFEEALELVSGRRVLLRMGSAYVHKDDLVPLIVEKFRAIVNEGLDAATKVFAVASEDVRIGPVLKNLPKQYLGKDYSELAASQGNRVDIQNIDALAERSFPICMQSMHEKLRTTHHLKHGARLQYGLFLKGIGVTLEDSIRFWRSEFTRKMSTDEFEREHVYNIRHSYGKEGRKQNYTPYSCVKIIKSDPSPSEDHGCPFKHFTQERLVASLRKHGADSQTIGKILEDVRAENWGHACRKYFKAKHPGFEMKELVINHPHQYYYASTKYYQMTPEEQQEKKELEERRQEEKRKAKEVDDNRAKLAADDEEALEAMVYEMEHEDQQKG